MKSKISIIIVSVFTAVLLTASGVFAHTITVANGSGKEKETVPITITTTNPGDIAGSAFTILFDDETFTLESVESGFFDTFANQWAAVTPAPNPMPANSVVVDTITYDQPILDFGTQGVVMLAGAQCQTGDTNGILFTLIFKIKDSATPGDYSIGIRKTVIDNTAAGYPSGGQEIPYLVGADLTKPLAEAYTDFNDTTTVVPGTITVEVNFIDTDGDGIDDIWEGTKFGDLTTADETTDHDQDGYTDLQEYLYSKDPHNEMWDSHDPDGNAFDPWVPNTEKGEGYNRENDFWDDFHTESPEDMIRYNNKIAYDWGNKGWGLWTYDYSWTQLTSADSEKMVSVDVDNDGEDELIGSFVGGVGLWVHDSQSGWNKIDENNPESMVKFGDVAAVDFGASGGLKSYDTANGWIDLGPETPGTDNPGLMVAADIDNDGIDELIVSFSGITDPGVYAFDPDEATPWSKINTVIPEIMIAYGKGLAADFGGAGGLKSYDNANKWIDLGPENPGTDDPGPMVTADVDNDGKVELAVSFANITNAGLYIYDPEETQPWNKITEDIPEKMIAHGNGLAIDFGACDLPDNAICKGLNLYNQNDGLTRLTTWDADGMVSVDIDKDDSYELAVNFPSHGLLIFDDSLIIKPIEVLAQDWGNQGWGLWTYDPTDGYIQLTGSEPIEIVMVDFDSDGKDELVGSFVGIGMYVYDDGVWTNFHSASPEAMIRFGNKLAGDWGNYGSGLWTYHPDQPGDGWIQLTPEDPIEVITVDFDNDGEDELVGSFDSGMWVYDDDVWTNFHGASPEAMIRFGNKLAGDWGNYGSGLWTYHPADGWVQLTPADPIELVSVNFDGDTKIELVGSFTDSGVWLYAGGWSQIHTASPRKMITYIK